MRLTRRGPGRRTASNQESAVCCFICNCAFTSSRAHTTPSTTWSGAAELFRTRVGMPCKDSQNRPRFSLSRRTSQQGCRPPLKADRFLKVVFSTLFAKAHLVWQRLYYIVRMIFPTFADDSICRWASAASARGKVLSTTGSRRRPPENRLSQCSRKRRTIACFSA